MLFTVVKQQQQKHQTSLLINSHTQTASYIFRINFFFLAALLKMKNKQIGAVNMQNNKSVYYITLFKAPSFYNALDLEDVAQLKSLILEWKLCSMEVHVYQ